MNQGYQDAVTLARDWLRSTNVQSKGVSHSVEPTEFLYMCGLPIEHAFDAHPYCGSNYILTDASLDWLCLRSDDDKGAHDLLVRIATCKLLRNEPMSQQISLFAGMVLAGRKIPPASEGKRLAKLFANNVHLVFLAYKLSEGFGLLLSRNDESAVQESACDAVSQALASLGVARSPRAIKDLLFHKSAARVREVVHALLKYNQEIREPDPQKLD